MVSASAPSAMEPAKDLILVYTVQLKSDVVIASVHSEKIRMMMMIMIIIMSNMKGFM